VVVSDNSSQDGIRYPYISSEDSDDDGQILDPEDSEVVWAGTGGGFRIVDDDASTRTVPQFLFYEHGPVSYRLPEAPEWITEADRHMFKVDEHQAVTWEELQQLIIQCGESRCSAIEQKHYEELSVAPRPHLIP
jgi:hypothetical protein